jgi:hypothetical protein
MKTIEILIPLVGFLLFCAVLYDTPTPHLDEVTVVRRAW